MLTSVVMVFVVMDGVRLLEHFAVGRGRGMDIAKCVLSAVELLRSQCRLRQ